MILNRSVCFCLSVRLFSRLSVSLFFCLFFQFNFVPTFSCICLCCLLVLICLLVILGFLARYLCLFVCLLFLFLHLFPSVFVIFVLLVCLLYGSFSLVHSLACLFACYVCWFACLFACYVCWFACLLCLLVCLLVCLLCLFVCLFVCLLCLLVCLLVCLLCLLVCLLVLLVWLFIRWFACLFFLFVSLFVRLFVLFVCIVWFRCLLFSAFDTNAPPANSFLQEKPEARPRSPKREGNGIHTDREETVDDAKEAFVFTNERVKQNTFSMKLLRKKHRKLLRRDTPTTSGETTSEPDANFNKYTSMSSESFALEGRGRLFNITKLSGQVSRPDELRNPACVDSPSDEGPEELLAELQGLEMPCEQCAGEDSPGEVPDSQYKELSRNMQRLEGKFEALIALLQKEKLSGAEDGSAANGDRTTTV